MSRRLCYAAFLLCMTTFAANAAIPAPAPAATSAAPVQAAGPQMQCSIGPLEKSYGGTDWVVYSCSDRKTVVIYTAASNPGKEFYFMLFPQGDKLRLYGEGNGDRQFTDAAFKELERLTLRDAAELIEETEVVSQAPNVGD